MKKTKKKLQWNKNIRIEEEKEEMKSIFKCRCFWWHESIREESERERKVCEMKQSIHELLRHVQTKGRNEWTYRQFTIRLYRMRYKLTCFFILSNWWKLTRRDEDPSTSILKRCCSCRKCNCIIPVDTISTTRFDIKKNTQHTPHAFLLVLIRDFIMFAIQ